VAFASLRGSARVVIGCSVFGASLVLLYAASTLYHSIPLPRVKRILRILDHSGIFLLIAGTYTPFALTTLRGPRGWSFLIVLWGLALSGIALTATLRERFRPVALVLYLTMGWSAVFVASPLLRDLRPAGIVLVLGGGFAYTLGVVFYGLRRMPYHHFVWHLFVLAGSCLHYFAVLFFVIPGPSRPAG
jgi:hemolysin III